MNYEKEIAKVRVQLARLDAVLDQKCTAHLKERIRFADHCLDDAESILRHAAEAASTADSASFRAFAAHNIACAAGICLTAGELVKNYGPDLKEIV